MKKVPVTVHIINFVIKYLLFLLIFFTFKLVHFIYLPSIFIILIPLFFTLVGIIADWTIVPKYHNIPSALMGSLFMGFITYIIPFIISNGDVPFISVLLLSFFLGIVEVILHRVIVKPYLA